MPYGSWGKKQNDVKDLWSPKNAALAQCQDPNIGPIVYEIQEKVTSLLQKWHLIYLMHNNHAIKVMFGPYQGSLLHFHLGKVQLSWEGGWESYGTLKKYNAKRRDNNLKICLLDNRAAQSPAQMES